MNFMQFLKDRILQISLLLFVIITIEIFLLAYNVGSFIRIYVPVSIMGVYVITLLAEFYRRNKFYSDVLNTLRNLDEKYLISEMMEESNFEEGKVLNDVVKQIDKSMVDNVNKYKFLMEDYKEYIELWIHEIKTPIATSKMIIENNRNDVTISINEELEKVEKFIEQALFYARSNTVEKDYFIKKSSVKDIVNECIRKNKNELIHNKVSINNSKLDESISVNTDSKWIVFIMNQILQNSVKYGSTEIEIFAKKFKENVVLCFKDNGVGIEESEIKKVFEKGFTGTNGRSANQKSTGIGLYLCKKLCDKLGVAIELDSVKNRGTEVRLIFPNSSYMDL